MKRGDLLRHLEKNGCELSREGARHTIYLSRSSARSTAIPRHAEIENQLAKKICRDLGVPPP